MATSSAGVGRCDPHLRDSRLMSSMEKYRGQTWDPWTDMRTPGIRNGGIVMGTQRNPGWEQMDLDTVCGPEVAWSKGGEGPWVGKQRARAGFL